MNKLLFLISLASCFAGLVACSNSTTETTTTTTTTTTTASTTGSTGELSCLEDPTQPKCLPPKIYDVEDTDNIVYVKENEDFKILQIADLHLSPNNSEAFANDNPKRTYNDLKKLIYLQQPNLIVLTGDTLFGCSAARAKELADVIDEFKIPWTFTWGNHDTHSQSIEEKKTIEKEFLKSKYCLYRNDYENTTLKRRGDHLIQLRLEDTNKLLYAFYLIDSGTYSYNLPDMDGDNKTDGPGYESVYQDQLDQFESVMTSLNVRYQSQDDNKYDKVPNLIFQHMAIEEYITAWDLQAKNDPSAKLLFGKKLETPCPGKVNTGQFELMKKLNTKGMFVGHDHINTFGVLYQDILLAVGGQTGYSNTYTGNLTEPKNGLVITINSQLEMSAEIVYLNK